MKTLIIYPLKNGNKKFLKVDCVTSEGHDYSSDVTQFPVESGATVTDNILNKPKSLQIDGFISNTPLDETQADPENGINLFRQLMEIRNNKIPVSVSTKFGHYKKMVMSSVSLPVDAATGETVRFSATFTEIITVDSLYTTLPNIRENKKPLAQSKKNKARQPVAAKKEKPSSGLNTLLDTLTGNI